MYPLNLWIPCFGSSRLEFLQLLLLPLHWSLGSARIALRETMNSARKSLCHEEPHSLMLGRGNEHSVDVGSRASCCDNHSIFCLTTFGTSFSATSMLQQVNQLVSEKFEALTAGDSKCTFGKSLKQMSLHAFGGVQSCWGKRCVCAFEKMPRSARKVMPIDDIRDTANGCRFEDSDDIGSRVKACLCYDRRKFTVNRGCTCSDIGLRNVVSNTHSPLTGGQSSLSVHAQN